MSFPTHEDVWLLPILYIGDISSEIYMFQILEVTYKEHHFELLLYTLCLLAFIHSFFISLDRYLQNTYYMPCTVLGDKLYIHMLLIFFIICFIILMGFPGGSDSKESACNAGDLGPISGSGRSPGEGNGKPLQYSCLENSMDRGAWPTTLQSMGSQRVGYN